MDILKGLNPVQKKAVLHTQGPLLILAGAGSGKTLVLTRKIAYLVREKGVDPACILALTFTNKAAGEMKRRVEAILSNSIKDMWCGTFHSIGLRILRREYSTLGLNGNFSIYDDKEQRAVIKSIISDTGVDAEVFTPARVHSYIDRFKNEGLLPQDVSESSTDYFNEKMAFLYELYQESLERNSAVDFGDLIIKPIEIFKKNPQILAKYRYRFKYILVDEFQDTNRSQYNLIKMLINDNELLWVVGDDDQSIYGWRGAEIKNILALEKDFPSLSIIRLEQNYRSTKNILNAANSVIRNNAKRRGKTLWTDNKEGEQTSYMLFENERREVLWLGGRILEMSRKGKKFNDFAVFYRTNAQSRVVEEGFIRLGIPYEVVGGVRFYERQEIKDILAYIKLVLNPDDTYSLLRVINIPPRGIGKMTVEKAEEISRIKGISLLSAFEESIRRGMFSGKIEGALKGFIELYRDLSELAALTPYNFIENLLNKTLYLDMWKKAGEDARVENIEEFLSAAKEFETDNPDATLYDFLDHVALVRGVDLYGGVDNKVSLMTIHSAKGLEFPFVFIIGMEEGLFPHSKSITEGDVEEERRLCYVGITRAMEALFLSAVKERNIFGRTMFQRPSRFIDEIDPSYIKTADTVRPFYKNDFKGNVSKIEEVNTDTRFKTGITVEHPKFGIGKVIGKKGEDMVLVNFRRTGLKKLLLPNAPLKLLDYR